MTEWIEPERDGQRQVSWVGGVVVVQEHRTWGCSRWVIRVAENEGKARAAETWALTVLVSIQFCGMNMNYRDGRPHPSA